MPTRKLIIFDMYPVATETNSWERLSTRAIKTCQPLSPKDLDVVKVVSFDYIWLYILSQIMRKKRWNLQAVTATISVIAYSTRNFLIILVRSVAFVNPTVTVAKLYCLRFLGSVFLLPSEISLDCWAIKRLFQSVDFERKQRYPYWFWNYQFQCSEQKTTQYWILFHIVELVYWIENYVDWVRGRFTGVDHL